MWMGILIPIESTALLQHIVYNAKEEWICKDYGSFIMKIIHGHDLGVAMVAQSGYSL